MKIIVSILIGLISSFNASFNVYGSVHDNARQKNSVAGDTIKTLTDPNADYSIQINGESNLVQITQNSFPGKGAGNVTKQKKASNTIEIYGEENAVKIDQRKNEGGVIIQQNGKGNLVNIKQTNRNTVK